MSNIINHKYIIKYVLNGETSMKILIFGLPGSGKTTLAEPLAKLLGGVHINADEVRKQYEGHDMSKWDFSLEGRIKQANRMRHLADGIVKAGKIAVAVFCLSYQRSKRTICT